MLFHNRQRFLRHTIVALAALGLATPAHSETPTKETAKKCYSNESIPTHFKAATDVVAATFQGNTVNESIGYYKITNVWKGNQKIGDGFAFRLPCYERNPLMQQGKIYLFFMKPIPSTSVYESSSCFPVRILGDGQIHPNSSSLNRILDKERDKLNRR